MANHEPETSFEFICEWFLKAQENARKQGRHDSAKLWADGLEHLISLQSRRQLERAVIEAARKLNPWCMTSHGHKPTGWDELQAALKSLDEGGGA